MPTNVFQQVVTYNDSGLALLLNESPFINLSNTRFKDFEKITANRGTSVDFSVPPQMVAADGLTATFQAAEQPVQRLTVSEAKNVSYEFTAQEQIFNVWDWLEKFGEAAMSELGAVVDANVAQVAETDTYRFFGSPLTPISTALQLASMLAAFRNVGMAKKDTVCVLDDLTYPAVINSNLNQFVTRRNDEEADSWEIGEFSDCMFYRSNLLPTHTAGTEGQAGSTLTVVSTTTNADGAVISITFSGTNGASDADSVKQHDSFEFSDGVGFTNLRFLTNYGHLVTQQPVQFRATADAASTGGSQVTVTIDPPLQAASGRNQNINTEIVAGMQATVLDSHRCGLLMAGKPLYLAMPRLPSTDPFDSKISTDMDTGVSIRMYGGERFGQNQRGIIHDVIWGKKLVGKYAMKVVLPL